MSDQSKRADGLHRLMGRSVFPHSDRVVSENVNVRQLRQRGESDGRSCVIRKNEKSCAGRAKDPVIRDAVHDCAHAMLPNPETDVPAGGVVAGEITSAFDVIHGRPVEIGTSADQIRHRLRDWLQRFAAGFARREFGIAGKLRNFLE